MKPIKLVMSAFGSYAGEATVDFGMDAHGIFLITGDTGAGKTTIFDAICYALYDRTSGGAREGSDMRSQYASPDVATLWNLPFPMESRFTGFIVTLNTHGSVNAGTRMVITRKPQSSLE